MDAVAPPDRQRVLVLERPPPQRREQRVEIGEQDVRGPRELHAEAGVEHVRRRHPLVHEARLVAHMLGEMGQEGDHVVLGHRLDRVDPRDVELHVPGLPDLPAPPLRVTPSAACASAACASISNQMRNLVSGDQIVPSRGGNSAGSYGGLSLGAARAV